MLDSVLVIGDIKFSRILEFREGDRQGGWQLQFRMIRTRAGLCLEHHGRKQIWGEVRDG